MLPMNETSPNWDKEIRETTGTQSYTIERDNTLIQTDCKFESKQIRWYGLLRRMGV